MPSHLPDGIQANSCIAPRFQKSDRAERNRRSLMHMESRRRKTWSWSREFVNSTSDQRFVSRNFMLYNFYNWISWPVPAWRKVLLPQFHFEFDKLDCLVARYGSQGSCFNMGGSFFTCGSDVNWFREYFVDTKWIKVASWIQFRWSR